LQTHNCTYRERIRHGPTKNTATWRAELVGAERKTGLAKWVSPQLCRVLRAGYAGRELLRSTDLRAPDIF
jgi:hypothetical protein